MSPVVKHRSVYHDYLDASLTINILYLRGLLIVLPVYLTSSTGVELPLPLFSWHSELDTYLMK